MKLFLAAVFQVIFLFAEESLAVERDKRQARIGFPAPRIDFGDSSPGVLPNLPLVSVGDHSSNTRGPSRQQPQQRVRVVQVPRGNRQSVYPSQQGRRVVLMPGQSVPRVNTQRIPYATRRVVQPAQPQPHQAVRVVSQPNRQPIVVNRGNSNPRVQIIQPRTQPLQVRPQGRPQVVRNVRPQVIRPQNVPQPHIRPQVRTQTVAQPIQPWARPRPVPKPQQPRPVPAVRTHPPPRAPMPQPTRPPPRPIVRVIRPPANPTPPQNVNWPSGKIVNVRPQPVNPQPRVIQQPIRPTQPLPQPPRVVIRPEPVTVAPALPTVAQPKPILVPIPPQTPPVIIQQPQPYPQPVQVQPQAKPPPVLVVNPPPPQTNPPPPPVYTVVVTAEPPPTPYRPQPMPVVTQPVAPRERVQPQPRPRPQPQPQPQPRPMRPPQPRPIPAPPVPQDRIQETVEVHVNGGKILMEPYPENFCDLRAYPDDQLAMRNMQRVEYFVANMSCSRYFFECAVGQTFMLNCTSNNQVFDISTVNCNYRHNVKTCPDYDHILHCTIKDQCTPDQYACCAAPQKCISYAQRCDGVPDCADGEDENNCPSCASDEFPCVKSDKCIPYSKRCDGVPDDCYDQSNLDEVNCGLCAQNQYQCARSGACISMEQRCNGVQDCPNGEDELNCKTKGPKYLLCENQKQSVTKENWCNGVEDCLDGSDEFYCFYKKR